MASTKEYLDFVLGQNYNEQTRIRKIHIRYLRCQSRISVFVWVYCLHKKKSPYQTFWLIRTLLVPLARRNLPKGQRFVFSKTTDLISDCSSSQKVLTILFGSPIFNQIRRDQYTIKKDRSNTYPFLLVPLTGLASLEPPDKQSTGLFTLKGNLQANFLLIQVRQ